MNPKNKLWPSKIFGFFFEFTIMRNKDYIQINYKFD